MNPPPIWPVFEDRAGHVLTPDRDHSLECAGHEDRRESLSARYDTAERKVLLHCFAGCDTADVVAALDLTMSDLFEPHQNGAKPVLGKEVKAYDYRDVGGDLLYQNVRFEPKDFRQRRSNGNVGWIYRLDDVKRVVYRLPEIQKKKAVVWTEGERDADALWSLKIPATTSGSVSSWRPEFAQQLVESGVQRLAILPDNDEPGRKHAAIVAQGCQAAGIEVKVIGLPGLPEKGDVSDWLGMKGNTRDRLCDLMKEAPTWEPGKKPEASVSGNPETEKPQITTNDRTDMGSLHQETFDRLVAVNRRNPRVFQRNMELSRVRHDDDGRPAIESFSEAAMSGYLAETFCWLRREKLMAGRVTGGAFVEKFVLKPINVPLGVVKTLLNRPGWDGIPIIRGVVQVPVFLADGTLITTPGYQPEARIWYDPAPGFTVAVPDQPTDLEVAMAVDALLDLLRDFPFAEDQGASRANTLAYWLTPYCVDLIGDLLPLTGVDSSVQGAGKGKIVETSSILFTGAGAVVVSAPRDDENEFRKNITSQLSSGRPFITIDNVEGTLRSAALASVLTTGNWGDRTLGATAAPALRNRAVWAATGVNVDYAKDIVRRVVPIRLEPQVEDPYLRQDFKYPELLPHVYAHRAELVSAALTLIRAWIVRGRPAANHPTIGSYTQWADTMAGILALAGVKGFLLNYQDNAVSADAETEMWRAFVEAWWEAHQGGLVTAAILAPLAIKVGIVKAGDDAALALGRRLGKKKSKVYGGRKVVKVEQRSRVGTQWLLAPTGRPSGVDVVPATSCDSPETSVDSSGVSAEAQEDGGTTSTPQPPSPQWDAALARVRGQQAPTPAPSEVV